MKKSFLIIFIIFFSYISFAQIESKRFEISASGSLGSVSSKSESGDYTYESEARLYFNSFIRAGYFLHGGFEFEPEFYTFLTEGGKPSFVVSANIAYNQQIGETKFYPFLLIGYGLGNSYPFLTMTNSYIRMSDEFDVGCLNAGFGLKYFINNSIAIRTEFRYQRFHDEIKGSFYTQEHTIKINSLLIGFSILF
ncbi:MAG: outer membrane beta-barrel protein [Melioribacter sp.]|uniref:outer membrane beta-barrel protein n=1 Tax=Rosettibacter primus TaxID=3111523 RepID=UPI00247C480B|nr:outer membrane beta-barrel protein [Melioribacter sp.]